MIERGSPIVVARAWASIATVVERGAGEIAGVFVEPIVQRASGMRVYGADYLSRARRR